MSCCLVFAAGESNYMSVTGPCDLEFPRDHGPHPGYRTEWWYYTGNLRSKKGRRFGFQLTFFRTQISPSKAKETWPDPVSNWRTQQVYLAHAAVSDINGKQHFSSERTLREALEMAGARRTQDGVKVFAKDWSARLGTENHHLEVISDGFSYHLNLRPTKNPILHGDGGYSRKGNTAERASCYYSFTRLETQGTITVNGIRSSVEGLSWMDHEFSTAPLEAGISGWDWFSLQLEDHTELMIYVLRLQNGNFHMASSGTFIDPHGASQYLRRNDFEITTLDTWRSIRSGAIYPSKWRVKVFPLSLNLVLVSNLADQEMVTPESTNITYWEGSVSVTGTRQGLSAGGEGYVEMTGYAESFDALF
jgi:predicted secreted hydrolase